MAKTRPLRLWLFTAAACLAASGAAPPAAAQSTTITLSATGGMPISPYLYGINYVWDKVPGAEFDQFQSLISRVTHYTIARYPGGWNAERLDWAQNIETKQPPASPGIDARTFLAAVPAATFITASQPPIAHPEKIPAFVERAVHLVRLYGQRVNVWEIGNEWWLQDGAQNSPERRAQNLQNYAALLAAIVPAMKLADPSIRIYATGDWTHPEEFATLRDLTGAAWQQVDGVSIHPYCGTQDPTRLCSRLPEAVAQTRADAGKTPVYASEWAVGERQTTDDYGIKNAAYTMSAMQDLVFAGVQMAAYWPPVKNVPGHALIDADYSDGYATGYLFGWMATYYRGTAWHTTGSLPAVAARDGTKVTVFVAGGAAPSRNVDIDLNGTGLHNVVSAQVMYAANPGDAGRDNFRKVSIVNLPVTIRSIAGGTAVASFVLNPGTPGRGTGFEIARVTLE